MPGFIRHTVIRWPPESSPKSPPIGSRAAKGSARSPRFGSCGELDSSLPADQPVICWGLERLTQGAPELSNTDLDEFFPHRPAVILDISRTRGVLQLGDNRIQRLGGSQKPPADPPASRFGRNADGTSNGRAYETGAVVLATSKVQQAAIPTPAVRRSLVPSTRSCRRDHEQRSLVRPGHAEGLRGIGVIAQLPDRGRGSITSQPIPTAQSRWDQPSRLTGLWKAGVRSGLTGQHSAERSRRHSPSSTTARRRTRRFPSAQAPRR